MRGHAKSALQVTERVVSRGEVNKLVSANGDVAGVSKPVLPDTQNGFRIRRLRVQHMNDVISNLQTVVDTSSAGVALHSNFSARVNSVGNPVALYINSVAGNYLIGTEGVMNTDILVYICRSHCGI